MKRFLLAGLLLLGFMLSGAAQWQVPSGCGPLGRGVGVGFACSGTATFQSRSEAQATTIGAAVQSIRLEGFLDPGDLGQGAVYTRTASACNVVYRFASADGQCWQLANKSVVIGMTGGGGGVADDTAAVQGLLTYCNSLGNCVATCSTGTFLVDTITLGSSTRIEGSCTFKQRTASNRIFSISGVHDVSVRGLRLESTSPTLAEVSLVRVQSSSFNVWFENNYCVGSLTVDSGYAGPPLSGNVCIDIVGNSSWVYVRGNTMYRFNYWPVYFEQSTDIHVDDNILVSNAFGPRCRGSQRWSMDNNIVDTTVLASSTPTSDQFAVMFGVDSTDGHAFGICEDGTINANKVYNVPYGQAVLIHAGKRISVTANTMNNVSTGISVVANQVDDIIDGITIAANTGTGTDAVSIPIAFDMGIQVDGGPVSGGGGVDAADPKNITVVGNTMSGFNKKSGDAGLGCISIGFTITSIVANNVLSDCGASGINVHNRHTGLKVFGNSVNSVTAVTAIQNCISIDPRSSTPISGEVSNNFCTAAEHGISIYSATTMAIGANYTGTITGNAVNSPAFAGTPTWPVMPADTIVANNTGTAAAAQNATFDALMDRNVNSTIGALAVRASTWDGLFPSATIGQALISNGTGVIPGYGAINLAGGASIVTGLLPLANLGGLGTGIGTWLATPSSANLALAIADETGSGLLVFATNPLLTTPRTQGYTVGTLPAGTVGMRAHVTDQLTSCPAIGAALTGGGAVVCPVFYNGSAWVGG